MVKKSLLLLLTLFLIKPACLFSGSGICDLVFLNSSGDKISLKAEVADTPRARARGLMFRESLDTGSGMLFVFEKDEPVSFWMKNTSIPLSIAFADSDGVIFQIKDLTPFSEKPRISSGPARYAVEVNRGWFNEKNITPGDRFINGCIRK